MCCVTVAVDAPPALVLQRWQAAGVGLRQRPLTATSFVTRRSRLVSASRRAPSAACAAGAAATCMATAWPPVRQTVDGAGLPAPLAAASSTAANRIGRVYQNQVGTEPTDEPSEGIGPAVPSDVTGPAVPSERNNFGTIFSQFCFALLILNMIHHDVFVSSNY